MSSWEPATEAEYALRDALRANDQARYFRILSGTELLLPVPGPAPAGQALTGWGTWTTGGRTHVLAFTSAAALRACLPEHGGPTRSVPYRDLAAVWPSHEWWLAVNPGLPIEGYLPAWFVSQLARGDVRLPGRTLGARARLERVESLARARATAAVPGHRNAASRAPQPTETTPPVAPAQATAPVPAASAPAVPAPAEPPAPPAPADPPAPAAVPDPPAVPAARIPDYPEDSEPSSGWLAAAYRERSVQADAANGATRSLLNHVAEPPPTWTITSPPPPYQNRPGAWHSPAPNGTGSSLAHRYPVTPPPAVGERDVPRGAGGTPVSSAEPPDPDRPARGSRPVVIEGIVVQSHDETVQFPQPQGADEAAPVAPEPSSGAEPERPEPPVTAPPAGFQPANEVEEELLVAAGNGRTQDFLSTLLLARVLLPVSPASVPGSRPGEQGFVWQRQELDGEPYVIVYTSPQRLADHSPGRVETAEVRFAQLIRKWPDETWSFAVNPGTPVGAKLPGAQIVALANWAAEVGLGDDAGAEPPEAPAEEPAERMAYTPVAEDPKRPTMMQKTIIPGQLEYYLERGYDRVSGFVHRVNEVAHLNTPAKLYAALGLNHPGSPFSPARDEVHVLRWPAYRPSLYRIPYGGQTEPAMRAMEGWVIERPPFRGNGFAPGESSDVVAEFKVDSVRLPHGAQIWRLGADGGETLVATLDSDTSTWRRVDEQ